MKSRKLNIFISIVIAVFVFSFTSCSKWTDQENINYFELPDDAYYEALREYKASDHQVSFGWFGNWTGTGSSLVNSLIGLPDSVDVISIWSNATSLTEAQYKDLRFVQKVKGTKVLYCLLILDIGDGITPKEYMESNETRKAFWGWVDGDNEAIYSAIRKYANAIGDTIDKYGYDGFDLDWEPSYAQPFPTNRELAPHDRIGVLIETLSKRIGPKSRTGRLFVIDGEPANIPKDLGENFDLFISQAYRSSGESTLNSRLNSIINYYEGYLTAEEVTNKFVVTENFESVYDALAGGYNFTDSQGNKMKSLEGMARWQPSNGFIKGGVGTYHMEAEYPTKPEYKWLRNAIQIMNPSLNLLIK